MAENPVSTRPPLARKPHRYKVDEGLDVRFLCHANSTHVLQTLWRGLHKKMDVSERRACRVLEQPRSSQRYLSTKVGKDAALVERMVALSKENPRYGYRRVWALLRREGWEVNKKRVQRLWREAGLRVPAKEFKRRRLATSENGCTRRRAKYIDHVWSYDFAMDTTQDGRRLKVMPVVDEYSRECLALQIE